MKIYNGKIPFDQDGNLCSFSGYWNNKEWLDNFIFEDTLLYCGYTPGTSSAYINFVSIITRKKYLAFLSDFHTIVPWMVNGEVSGKFTFVKKGNNFGIKRIYED